VPDIVCLAKALGGGVPCGAIGGNAEVMDARATLREVLAPAAYAHFDDLRDELAAGARRSLERHHVPGYVSAFGAKGAVVFSPTPICDYRDFCRGRSVNLPRSRPACWRERGKLAVPPRVTPAG
jgi:glutamate-1-semialdehyde 2,1-aminomutase